MYSQPPTIHPINTETTIIAYVIVSLMFAAFFYTVFYAYLWVPIRRSAMIGRATTAEKIPLIFSKLRASPIGFAFANFDFRASDKIGNESIVSLKLTMIKGKMMFDWVLERPRNIADQDRFAEFIKAEGLTAEIIELNGMKSLRVEEGDLGTFCLNIITRFYGLPKTTKLEMIARGFTWKREKEIQNWRLNTPDLGKTR
jgi:hypothetical protein